MKPIVWIIDDEQGICVSLALALKKDYEVSTFNSAAPALERMKSESCDVVLLDLRLQDEDGIDVLRRIKQDHPDVTVIMMTAYGSIGSSVEAIRAGAYTYLTKPLDLEQLKLFLSQAMEVRQMNEQIRFLSDELRSRQTYRKIIGESEVMQRVYARINQVKDVDASVLITGESGTGKELVARAIHDEGKRKNERFVSINCAAIPERLLELELFGYRKGAFAGADQDRKGKLELAAKGTIFLNEIGDMPLKLQGKLLRVLREREFSPVGSTEVRHTDVRVIVATNQDLRRAMDQQKFRQDLYYRLNVIEIAMPSLRDRMGDVPLLCAHFLQETAAEMNKPVKTLTPAAKEALMRYNYPGNVRQLANILEYATIVSTGESIDVADLPDEITGGQEGQQPSSAALEQFLSSNNLKELERRAILATLKKNNGRRDKTAEDLGISKRGLLNKLNEYNIH